MAIVVGLMSNKSCRLLIFIALLLSAIMFAPVCSAVSVDEASIALNQANQDLNSAFNAVSLASGSGADVASLLGKLSVAGNDLSEANIAFRVGDYENAYVNALACSNALKGVGDEASHLLVSAEGAHSQKVLLTMIGSGVGFLLLIVLGLLGWRFLSKRYFRRMLDLKPLLEDHT